MEIDRWASHISGHTPSVQARLLKRGAAVAVLGLMAVLAGPVAAHAAALITRIFTFDPHVCR